MATLNSYQNAKRLVLKIGSALLVDGQTGALRLNWLQDLAKDVAQAKAEGRDVLGSAG